MKIMQYLTSKFITFRVDGMLARHKISENSQLKLFQLDNSNKEYSNTVELYDVMPKYSYGQSIDAPAVIDKTFKHRNIDYRIIVMPAKIRDMSTGSILEKYPAQREEIIEDVLRKFACHGNGLMLDDQAGVTFTLYELHQELVKHGHGYNINEIKEALWVCARTAIDLISSDNKVVLSSNMFQSLYLNTRDEGRAKSFVRFHPLVTRSINNMSFRRINYDQCMQHKAGLSRWLHKRLSHHFIQADSSQAYNISLSTILECSGAKTYTRLTSNKASVIGVLDELKENNVILEYSVKDKKGGKQGNKITDVIFYIKASQSFIADAIANNAIAEQNMRKLVMAQATGRCAA